MAPAIEDVAKKKDDLKKKLSKQKQMTLFGLKEYKVTQKRMKKVGKNQYRKVGEFIRIESSPAATAGVFKSICDDCLRQFENKQGLGSHRVHCKAAITKQAKDEALCMKETQDTHDSTVFIPNNVSGGDVKTRKSTGDAERNRTRKDLRMMDDSSVMLDRAGFEEGIKQDKRSSNRGASVRQSYTSRYKVNFVEEISEAMNQDPAMNVTRYLKECLKCTDSQGEKLRNQYYSWSKHPVYESCFRDLLGMPKNSGGRSRKKGLSNSPFQEIEVDLYRKFVEHRKKGRKVSSSWIRINAMKIYNEKKAANPDKWESKPFKASFGWMRRFIKRKAIKFRKRKCGKEKTAEECITEFENFMHTLRFDFLPPREDDGYDGMDPLWGRFPPELRYNMDQVPLPFVVSQDDTFTMDEDHDINIKCPQESLRKRQFTMHQVFNAGVGDKAHGWCDMVCRGTGKRISKAEKNLYDNDISVFWQPKAWVDKVVMRQLAERFVKEKNNKHGEDVWVLLFCDNLKAHLDEEVKIIFGDAKVLLFYFPPNMTNFIQPIDAGLGRSVRIAIGNYLDLWLMDADNMERWESKLTAGERRILSIGFLGQAMRKIMTADYDDMRVGCFERTGCLMTLIANNEYDRKINPQGMKIGSFSIPSERLTVDVGEENVGNMNDIEGQGEEDAALQEEQALIDENNAEDEGYFWMEDEPLVDNDSDDGGEIDDNPENTSE